MKCVNTDILERAFPFHFAFDPDFKIIQLGKSLQKIVGRSIDQENVEEHFKLLQPKIPFTIEDVLNNLDKEYFFLLVDKQVQLRGEVIFDIDHSQFLFLGGPWFSSLAQVDELALTAKDFSIHDPSLHYFNVIQQHQNALEEANRLTEKLYAQGKELKEKEEQLSMALEGGQDGIWDWRIDSNDFYYSPRLVEMLGYQYGEIRPHFQSIEKLIEVEDSIRFEGAFAQHFRSGDPFDIECRWKTKQGPLKWILTRGKVVEWNSDGSALRMVGLNSDIDERKKSEEELKRLHIRLVDAIEIIDSGFAIYDKNEKLVVCNSKYKQMFSEASEVLIPGTPYDLILDILCKNGVAQASGVEPSTWVAKQIAFHRSPGIDREERLKKMWVRISERRTSEGGIVSLLTDITERVNAEEALKKYAEIVQSTYEGIMSFDLQGVITSWNPACYDIFGYTPQEAVGQHIAILFPDLLMPEMAEMLEDLRHGSTIERHETTRIKKNHAEVYISQTISPIIDKKERILGASCVVQDVTSRKKIEEEMKKRDKILQGINEGSHYLLTEPQFYIAIGLAIACVAQAVGAELMSVQFEDQKEETENLRYIWNGSIKKTQELANVPKHWMDKLLEGKDVQKTGDFTSEERPFLTLENARSILLIPLIVEGGWAGFISIENTTERVWGKTEIILLNAYAYSLGGSFSRKVAEEQVKASEEKFKRVFSTSKDGIIAVNPKGFITMFNPAAEKMFMVHQELAVGQKLNTFFPDEYVNNGEGFVQKEVQEIYAKKPDGKQFPVEISLSQQSSGEQNFVVGIIRDITERKHAEELLSLAREKELDIGFRIQHALLLGKPPENLKGITVSVVTIASQGIDGDFYDFFPLSRNEFDLLIGDVMGKGIPAALLGAATKSAFNHAITTLTTTSKAKPEPNEIVALVHAQITSQMIDLESFMTICFARFNNLSHQMTFVDCGHTNTLHFRKKEKAIHLLRGENVPLGFLEEEEYTQNKVAYDPGDIFLFYSDGVTEARGLSGEFFGLERLKNILLKSYYESGEMILKSIISSVEQFSQSLLFQDDLTVVLVKIEEKTLELEYLETIHAAKNLDYLETIRRQIVKFAQRSKNNIDPIKVIELELASNEVFTNIVRHSLNDEPRVDIILEMYSDRLRIHFDYLGKAFKPLEVQPPMYEKPTSGGFGLYIIEMMVDEVVYQEVLSSKQRITLTKYTQ